MSTWLAPPTQPCDPWDVSLACCKAAGGLSEDVQAEIVAWATNELWLATGQRIGLCTVTVNLCRAQPCDRPWAWWCRDCPPYDVIDLGPQWVTEVSSVTVNGDPLTKDTDWIVLDWRWLAKLSGRWPDTGAVITYTYGTPPDAVALRNAEILACEEAMRRAGDKNCRLARERSSRRDGRFEIPEIDAWVSIVNREDDCFMGRPEQSDSFWIVSSGG